MEGISGLSGRRDGQRKDEAQWLRTHRPGSQAAALRPRRLADLGPNGGPNEPIAPGANRRARQVAKSERSPSMLPHRLQLGRGRPWLGTLAAPGWPRSAAAGEELRAGLDLGGSPPPCPLPG